MGYVQGGMFQTLINLASSRAAFLGNRPQPWLGGCYNLPSLATKVFIADTGGWLWCLDLVGCPDLRIICWRCAVFFFVRGILDDIRRWGPFLPIVMNGGTWDLFSNDLINGR